MKKYILLFILLESSIVSFSQKLSATQKIPKEITLSSSFNVEITINKGELQEFIKLSQVLPLGFRAEEIDSKGGSFTFNEDGVRIIWTAPPKTEAYTVSYKVLTPSSASGALNITGKVSYIDGNERKIYDLPTHSLTISGTTIASASVPVKEEPKKEVVVVKEAEPVKTEPIKKTEEPTKTESVAKAEPIKNVTTENKMPVSAVPIVGGKTYKVQIGAFSSKPKIEGVPEISTLVLDNGITKYFSGNFSDYEQAVKRKKMMTEKGFAGAFIVSFQDGKIVK